MRFLFGLLILFFLSNASAQIVRADEKAESEIWKELKMKSGFKKVFKKYKKYRFEIIYTQIDRGLNNEIKLTDFHLGDSVSYFYPASTVKFPTALALGEILQKYPYNDISFSAKLKLDTARQCHFNYQNSSYEYHKVQMGDSWQSIAAKYRITKSDLLLLNNKTESDILSPNSAVKIYHRKTRPSIYDLISSMLIFSDNDAYNKLFEIAGGGNITSWLHQKGFEKSSITRKFLFCEGEEKNHSVSFDLLNDRDVILYHGTEKTWEPSRNSAIPGVKVGKAYYWLDSLVKAPRDFSDHNYLTLKISHEMMQRLFFPELFSANEQFILKSKTSDFIKKSLALYPREKVNVRDTVYDGWNDGKNIFLIREDCKKIQYIKLPPDCKMNPNFRIFNVIGQAYGFSTDIMYFTDNKEKVEYFLSVRIYTNKNEILGDDKYEYEQIAMPLMNFLGEYFYALEKNRKKEVLPDFTILHSLFD